MQKQQLQKQPRQKQLKQQKQQQKVLSLQKRQQYEVKRVCKQQKLHWRLSKINVKMQQPMVPCGGWIVNGKKQRSTCRKVRLQSLKQNHVVFVHKQLLSKVVNQFQDDYHSCFFQHTFFYIKFMRVFD